MERRFLFGIILLLSVLALAIGAAAGTKAIHSPGQQLLTQAAGLAAADRLDRALPLAEQAWDRWQKYRSVTAALADHSLTDTAEGLFRQLPVYAKTGEAAHFAACCARLSALLESLYEAHGFSLGNIL